MASTYTKQELLKKERIAYSKIHGMDKLLSAKPSERDGLVVAYPDAHFANNLFGHDREQCAIHQTAYFAILNGDDISDVRFRFDCAMKKYVERHLWDD